MGQTQSGQAFQPNDQQIQHPPAGAAPPDSPLRLGGPLVSRLPPASPPVLTPAVVPLPTDFSPAVGCSGVAPTSEEQEPSGESEPVPTVLQWSAGGTAVFVTGSFNAWEERIPLRRSGADHVVCLNLPPGTYQYKFIVDNEWRFATDQPTVRDEMGNINNCTTVIDQSMYLHEHAASGFFGDTPHNMYTQALPDEITLAKEPPLAPLQLSCIPLNMDPAPDQRIAAWTLPPPLSVTLTHLCLTPRGATATTMSVTHRFRNKFVTVVIYKPRLAPSAAALCVDSGPRSSQAMEQDDPWAAANSSGAAIGHDRLMPPPARDAWGPGAQPPVPRPPFLQEASGGSRKVSWSDLPSSAGGGAAMDIGSRDGSKNTLFMDLSQ